MTSDLVCAKNANQQAIEDSFYRMDPTPAFKVYIAELLGLIVMVCLCGLYMHHLNANQHAMGCLG
jgi:hypothetical protein